MNNPPAPAPLDLGKWRNVPLLLMVVGGAISLLGFFLDRREFAFHWLTAFMFFLSFGVGAMFLVIAHHLFDAGWSVPIRRFCEHIATLMFPAMAVLFIPIALMAPTLYKWMDENPLIDRSLRVKLPIFTRAGFYITSAACFLVWWFLSRALRRWSLRQDQTGEARCTYRMRFYSALGVVLFALSVTAAALLWVMALQHQWFSTMYGVYYFAGSTFVTLATVYVITMVLDQRGILTEVLHEHQYYFIGSLLFAFTVFYAYVAFAQYFIIWNGNMPEETFWYVLRERGTWWDVGLIIIFGHFFVPFLGLLRIDVKSNFTYMTAMAVWAWLMRWTDMAFNILPVVRPEGYPWQWLWLGFGCWAFMGGLLTMLFLREYGKYAPYPIKDPRLIEAMGFYHPVPTQISGGELDQTDELRDAPPQFGGTNR
jgi:hypothetical protein